MLWKYEYRPASPEDLERIWERDIAENAGDSRWIRWKKEFIENNENGSCKTFVVAANGEPVGQGTLLFSAECKAIRGRSCLAGGKTANINALRIQKMHEGKCHISKLVHMMEAYAKKAGYSALTIGVEAAETRNPAIYLHWGYRRFVMSETEDNVLVLYYSKNLES